MLTADWDSTNPLEVNLAKVRVTEACVCDTNILKNDLEEKIDVKVYTIGGTITQKLEFGEILVKEKLIAEQNLDPVLAEVRKWLENGKPDRLLRLRLPRDLSTYWKQLNLIVI